ncbi:MAG: diacylglycerol kinase family protein [Nakamurella sp.]
MSTSARSDKNKRWLARLALLAFLAAILLILGAGGFTGIFLFVTGTIAAALVLAGLFWFLAKRGLARSLGLAVAILAVGTLIFVYARSDVLIVALIAVVLFAIGAAAARLALQTDDDTWMPEVDAPPAHHPFIVMNPHSGGGKVVKFDLQAKAEALGAEVALMEGPGHVDVAALVRDAITRGADLLGVAGGDGTQALVAGIAAEHNLPFLVISAGTRNHFALDLGLDRDDPSTCLAALQDGVEVRVDLGMLEDRPFVNNASFGAYAEIVQSPQYRDHKEGTILSMLPDLLTGENAERLSVQVGGSTVEGSQAILVSNNPYGSGRLIDMARRNRLNQAVLGVVAGRLDSAAHAVALMRRDQGQSLSMLTGPAAVINADTAEIPVGVDGEALVVATPVHLTIRPGALRVRLPRHRPGVPRPKSRIEWDRLWRLVFGRTADPVRAG